MKVCMAVVQMQGRVVFRSGRWVDARYMSTYRQTVDIVVSNGS